MFKIICLVACLIGISAVTEGAVRQVDPSFGPIPVRVARSIGNAVPEVKPVEDAAKESVAVEASDDLENAETIGIHKHIHVHSPHYYGGYHGYGGGYYGYGGGHYGYSGYPYYGSYGYSSYPHYGGYYY